MPMIDIARVFATNKVLHSSFAECRHCLKDVETAGQSIVLSPALTPKEFVISASAFPASMYLPQRNFFSAVFQAIYFFLKIPPERRILYGRINYLFRIWVTSADNLLDNEDKVSFAINMPVDSRVMRQVVVIMAADRIMARFLDEAVANGVISPEGACSISDGTLQVLLPSAAEEASEEKGIIKRPDPAYVLNTIHHLKTGLLFHLPLFGPERIETNLDHRLLTACREGLGNFGLGCQLLDDMKDMARDHIDQRHNYTLSLLAHEYPSAVRRLQGMEKKISVEQSIYAEFAGELTPVARMAYRYMIDGLGKLNDCGLGLTPALSRAVALWMFKALDVDDARSWLS
ncbi:MAG: hypothetical protein HQL22_04660 [Candidatus Omnitrophica bacterium]|nr:hypothetical protein [Candidatus Omnitrophota bacterium]